nr:MAG TPA: hypothetical protein [Caudoviricetes sp.]
MPKKRIFFRFYFHWKKMFLDRNNFLDNLLRIVLILLSQNLAVLLLFIFRLFRNKCTEICF